MSEYTELQAKQDAVDSWEIILQFIKDNEDYCSNDAGLFHVIKREALKNTKYDKFVSLCSYCEFSDINRLSSDCSKCIGVQAHAFGVNDKGIPNICYDTGSYADITKVIRGYPNVNYVDLVSCVTIQLNKLKEILKNHEDTNIHRKNSN